MISRKTNEFCQWQTQGGFFGLERTPLSEHTSKKSGCGFTWRGFMKVGKKNPPIASSFKLWICTLCLALLQLCKVVKLTVQLIFILVILNVILT